MIFDKLKMNRKGDISCIIILVVIVFILAVVSVIFSRVFIATTTELKSQPMMGNNSINAIETVEDNTIPLLDFFVFFSLISLIVGLIISSIFIKTHPAVAIVFAIGLIIAVILAGLFANIYGEVTEEEEIVSTAEQFTFTNLILGAQYPVIILVVGIIAIIILYGKSRQVQGPV